MIVVVVRSIVGSTTYFDSNRGAVDDLGNLSSQQNDELQSKIHRSPIFLNVLSQ
jgi:hypothetical protein